MREMQTFETHHSSSCRSTMEKTCLCAKQGWGHAFVRGFILFYWDTINIFFQCSLLDLGFIVVIKKEASPQPIRYNSYIVGYRIWSKNSVSPRGRSMQVKKIYWNLLLAQPPGPLRKEPIGNFPWRSETSYRVVHPVKSTVGNVHLYAVDVAERRRLTARRSGRHWLILLILLMKREEPFAKRATNSRTNLWPRTSWCRVHHSTRDIYLTFTRRPNAEPKAPSPSRSRCIGYSLLFHRQNRAIRPNVHPWPCSVSSNSPHPPIPVFAGGGNNRPSLSSTLPLGRTVQNGWNRELSGGGSRQQWTCLGTSHS